MAVPDQPGEPGASPGAVTGPAVADAAGNAEPAGGRGSFSEATADGAGLGSLGGDLRTLADDARTLVAAELAYQSARAAYVWNRGQRVAVWLVVALACGFFALVALVVGLLLALIPLLGVWIALAVVALGLALGGALALRLATREIRRIRGQALAADPVVAPTGVTAPEPMGPPAPPEAAT